MTYTADRFEKSIVHKAIANQSKEKARSSRKEKTLLINSGGKKGWCITNAMPMPVLFLFTAAASADSTVFFFLISSPREPNNHRRSSLRPFNCIHNSHEYIYKHGFFLECHRAAANGSGLCADRPLLHLNTIIL